MDWNNVDLKNESDANILDAYTFDALLLEINCNLPEINASTVTEQFETALAARIYDAREVFKSNLENIVKFSQKERNRK